MLGLWLVRDVAAIVVAEAGQTLRVVLDDVVADPRLGAARNTDAVCRALLSDQIVADPSPNAVNQDPGCGPAAAWRQVPHPIAANQAPDRIIIAGSDAVRGKSNAAVSGNPVDDIVDHIDATIHDDPDAIERTGPAAPSNRIPAERLNQRRLFSMT